MDKIQKLVRSAAARRRLQRFIQAASLALLPVLAATTALLLLAKQGWLHGGEARVLLILTGVLGLIPAAVAAAWPVRTLDTLIRLESANGLGGRLSSTWDFLRRAERTPEMELHIERTLAGIDRVDVRPAEPFALPGELLPALGIGALLIVVSLMIEPEYPELSAVALPEPAPEIIVDTGRLLADARNIEALQLLAETSDDPELQQAAAELDQLVDALQRGAIREEELLQRLDALDELLAARDAPEAPLDLSPALEDIADELAEALDELGIDPDSPLSERIDEVLRAVEEGDEAAIADALDEAADLLAAEDIDPEMAEQLADLLEQFSDLIDPTDPDLQERYQDLLDQVEGYEERVADTGRSRDQRRLDDAREALGEAEEALNEAAQNRDRNEEAQSDLSETLGQAAERLREQAAEEREREQSEDREGAEGELDEQEGEGTGDAGDEGGDETESEGSERESQSEGQVDPDREPESAEGDPEGSEGEQEGDPGEADPDAQTDHESEAEGVGDAGELTTADALEQAADDLRDAEREEAAEEAQERAERATDDLRENLQRNSQSPQGDTPDSESDWQSFEERAGGEEMEGEIGEGDESDPEIAQQGEATEDGEQPEDLTNPGDEEGGDPLGEESEALGSERERENVEGDDSGDETPTAGEVFRTAATDGFASTDYRDIYVEYERVAEDVLESEEIPRGYVHFVRRYFELIEPRVTGRHVE